jgi:coenzyme F420-reducing hydrogenase delta subunit
VPGRETGGAQDEDGPAGARPVETTPSEITPSVTTDLPRILAFSTNNISDPGIDLAGSSHIHYSPRVVVISLPCTSGIKPEWVLYALQRGFDGVFIASDGEECGYLSDCTERSSRIFARAQHLLIEQGFNPQRLKIAAICSVCAEPFVNHVREFNEALAQLGPVRRGNG